MQITIHRGTHEIGGSCIEISTQKTKILIDIGLPLDFDKRPQKEQQQIRQSAKEWCADVDAIFISHYHADHHGLLPELEYDVPVYMTAGTHAMLRVSETVHQNSGARYMECIHIIPRTANGKSFLPIDVGDLQIIPFSIDHAALDACAFLIEGDDRKVLYSGDIRLHGVKGRLYHALPTGVDYLLLEGTNLSSEKKCEPERDICEQFKDQFRTDADKLHYIWCSGQNIDRIVQIYRAALACGRKLIVDTYIAYVLETAHKLIPSIPSPLEPIEGHDVFRYFRLDTYISKIEATGNIELATKLKDLPAIDTKDIGQNPGKYAWIIRPSMLRIMDKYRHTPSVVVTSLWNGYEKEEPELMEWIKQRGFANPYIHTSGHADVSSLKRIVKHINPTCIVPIHTDQPERYIELYPDRNILFLRDGQPIRL